MLSSFLKLMFALSKNPESKLNPKEKGGRSGGPVGVPQGPDCTGSTVTEPLQLWHGLCGPAGLKRPAGAARENLQAEIGQCQGEEGRLLFLKPRGLGGRGGLNFKGSRIDFVVASFYGVL